jgi:hypothetical protein
VSDRPLLGIGTVVKNSVLDGADRPVVTALLPRNSIIHCLLPDDGANFRVVGDSRPIEDNKLEILQRRLHCHDPLPSILNHSDFYTKEELLGTGT